MKKLFEIISVIIVILVISACTKTEYSIVGLWHTKSSSRGDLDKQEVKFYSNGKFYWSISSSTSGGVWNGMYSLEDGTLLILVIEGESYPSEWQLTMMDKNTIILKKGNESHLLERNK